MPLSRRYSPEHPPGETCLFGMDFSFVLPPNTQIVSAAMTVMENSALPIGTSDWSVGPVQIAGTAVFALLSGGVEGTDYRLVWTITDSDGNVFPRTALVLCAATS